MEKLSKEEALELLRELIPVCYRLTNENDMLLMRSQDLNDQLLKIAESTKANMNQSERIKNRNRELK